MLVSLAFPEVSISQFLSEALRRGSLVRVDMDANPDELSERPCSKIRSPFSSLAVSTQHYTAVLDALSPETYILVVAKGHIRKSCTPPLIHSAFARKLSADSVLPHQISCCAESAALELNIRLARPHFATLEAIGMGRS